MYLTDRAGAILRHHTRSSQEGHHTVKRTGVPKAMVAAVRVRARRGTARVPVDLFSGAGAAAAAANSPQQGHASSQTPNCGAATKWENEPPRGFLLSSPLSQELQ